MALPTSILSLPSEVLEVVFKNLSTQDILNLPCFIRHTGLSAPAARSRFGCQEISLTKDSLEDLCNLGRCLIMANAVERLVIRNETPKVPDEEGHLMWQWLRHFQNVNSSANQAKYLSNLGNVLETGISMREIHRAVEVSDWSDCKICDGIPPPNAHYGLIRAGREQEELQASEMDVALLVNAFRHFRNLNTIIINNTNAKSGIGRRALKKSGWANVTSKFSVVHSLAVLFKALEVVGPRSVTVETCKNMRPRIWQRIVPMPISLSDLASEVSIRTISSAVGNIKSLRLGGLKLTQEESQVPALLRDDHFAEQSSDIPTTVLTEIINSATNLTTLFLGYTTKHEGAPDQNPGLIHFSRPQSMMVFPHLRSLKLVNFWSHEHHLRAFLHACPSLVELHLEDIELRPGTWYTLFNGLRGAHTSLDKLQLVSCKRVAHGTPDVDAIARQNMLTALKIWLCGNSDIIPIEYDFEFPRRPERRASAAGN